MSIVKGARINFRGMTKTELIGDKAVSFRNLRGAASFGRPQVNLIDSTLAPIQTEFAPLDMATLFAMKDEAAGMLATNSESVVPSIFRTVPQEISLELARAPIGLSSARQAIEFSNAAFGALAGGALIGGAQVVINQYGTAYPAGDSNAGLKPVIKAEGNGDENGKPASEPTIERELDFLESRWAKENIPPDVLARWKAQRGDSKARAKRALEIIEAWRADDMKAEEARPSPAEELLDHLLEEASLDTPDGVPSSNSALKEILNMDPLGHTFLHDSATRAVGNKVAQLQLEFADFKEGFVHPFLREMSSIQEETFQARAKARATELDQEPTELEREIAKHLDFLESPEAQKLPKELVDAWRKAREAKLGGMKESLEAFDKLLEESGRIKPDAKDPVVELLRITVYDIVDSGDPRRSQIESELEDMRTLLSRFEEWASKLKAEINEVVK